ncbi:MAG: hypothetical protein ABWK53_04260 [Anaerolineales bacterium]
MDKIRDLLKKPIALILVSGAVGLILGLIWAWGIQPVEWKDASPALLHPVYREEYLRMAIDSFRLTGDAEQAVERFEALGPYAYSTLDTIVSNPGSQDPVAIASFAEMVRVVVPPASEVPQATPSQPASGSFGRALIILVAVLAVGGVGYMLFRYLLPLFRRSGGGALTPAQQARQISRQTEMTDYAAMGEEPPIAQFMTTFVIGDDLFDDSFSIENQAGEFMGECGIGISETIGVGEPKKVTAFELWLFDKNDIQTVTKVLMSRHAFDDPATYQRLQNKGEPVLAELDKQIVLETAALQLVAIIADMEYGQGALPAESFFNRLTLEIAVWPKIMAPE